jgi:hypothetical protein
MVKVRHQFQHTTRGLPPQMICPSTPTCLYVTVWLHADLSELLKPHQQKAEHIVCRKGVTRGVTLQPGRPLSSHN